MRSFMKERCYFDVAYVALWNMGDNNVVEVSRVERCVQSVCSFLRRAASKCVAFCRALRDLENHYLGHNPRSLHSTSHGVSEKDKEEIEKANLPLLWICSGPGAPIQAIVDKLARMYNFHHIYVGDILSQEVRWRTGQSEIAHQLMYRGMIVPRSFIIEIIKRDMVEAIRNKNVKGFLFSDYPSTTDQAKSFIDEISPVDCAIVLKFSELTMSLNAFQLYRAQSYSSRHLSQNKDQLRVSGDTAVKDYLSNLKLISKLAKKTKVVDGQLALQDAYRELKNLIEEVCALRNKVTPVVEVKSPEYIV